MPAGLKINDLSREECVELCQFVSNCAAVGWSSRYHECTFHHLELPLHEQHGNTLYTAGGGGIATSTTSTTSTTTVPTTTITTSTEVMTTASTGTFLGTLFVRRDKNLLTSKSLRRACLECALLCFQSNRSDFTSINLNDDGTCSISASGTPGSSPKKLFEWIKL
ncbi:uncharacterized protein [Haliotis cracherodii]|uniref:uncharacterized protein n=1 Tax=Haliotis cracherodii TaxID=6455 RepID=UPI0039E745BF